MAGPQNTAYRAQLYRELARVSPEVRELIAKDALESQKSVVPLPYWSKVRWQADRVGAAPGPYTFAFPQQQRAAFSYGIGGDAQLAGFAAGFQATMAETNLVKANETNDNADFIIEGISVSVMSDQTTEPLLLGEIFQNTSVEFSFSGQTSLRLNNLIGIPGAGGPYGAQASIVRSGVSDSVQGSPISYVANGNPMAGNFLRFRAPFRWNAAGGGKKDSSLQVILQQRRAFTLNSSADRAASAPVEAFSVPASIHLDLMIALHGVSVSERSNNA